MPRAKKKAKAAASNQDFQKKKPKIGRQARPASFTNTTVRQKQVFLPDQSRSQEQLTSTKTGLSFTDLLPRTRHHNANTRTAALNGLTNGLKLENAVAHDAIVLSPAPAIHAAATAIADENAPTRTAARNLLINVWSFLDDVQPFRSIFSTALLACLSHIRLDIRLDGARTLVALLETNRMAPEQLFADTANPLESLCDLLAVTTGVKGRTAVLDALCSLCEHVPRSDGSERVPSHASPAASQQTATENTRTPLPFYYHRSPLHVNEKHTGQLFTKFSTQLASNLIARVANLLTESFPLIETRRDKNKYTMFLSASQALFRLVTNCSPEANHKPVHRCLKLWSAEDGASQISTADIHFAGTAIHLASFDACQDFLVSALNARSYPAGLELCVANYIESCDENLAVLESWCNRFEAAAHEENANILCRSLRICEVVLKRRSRNETIVWRLLKCLPFAIQACAHGKGDAVDSETSVNVLIKLFSSSYRSLQALGSNAEQLQTTMENLVDIVCAQRLALKLNHSEVDQIVGVLAAAKMITVDEVVSFIGFCFREGNLHLAERFLMGVEAAAVNENEEKYRAIALAKALKLVSSGLNSNLTAQLERIESVVC
ncbi:unnamed protein product [Agarophyton chilense]|eukprot:gb/GEZJ01004383.1/.p1 GENE.gb/GEZJ01004383.1/~~gb/GEZJ01004383.1/.p1  ORF type:complete len:608 (+),score=86.14 gb/GEZJ01004383.1/:2049-3872(+)